MTCKSSSPATKKKDTSSSLTCFWRTGIRRYLGFHYDTSINGSIASMVDACDLVNIHKHKHVHTPPTQSFESTQIYFIFMSAASAEFILHCGILYFNNLFLSDRHPLYIDIDVLRLLGLLNYSHSRNPPCAPARTHGRTQAPREPPN
jgi:hypothetical protein